MEFIGAELSSREHWQRKAETYAAAIEGPYHQHRLAVIRALLPDLKGKRVLDFGCGEGVLLRMARDMGASNVVGIEAEPELARKAGPEVLHGGVEHLQVIGRADCLIAANVLAYLSREDESEFYACARLSLPVGGHLVVMHSNELFDLFTFNRFTVATFERHFGVDVSPLLTRPEEPQRHSYNIRENPLAYGDKLRALGFEVERIEYANFHDHPPLLNGAERTYCDTLAFPHEERWKLNFQCSMFGVRAVRV